MRNACNKFLRKCCDDEDFIRYACRTGYIENWIFPSSMGEMRSVFGVMIGQIASAYGIDVENDLVEIMIK